MIALRSREGGEAAGNQRERKKRKQKLLLTNKIVEQFSGPIHTRWLHQTVGVGHLRTPFFKKQNMYLVSDKKQKSSAN